MVCVLVDKMLKTQIVECSAVATWLFSKEMAPFFTHSCLWEILHLTIDKMNKHVSKLSECGVLLILFLIMFVMFKVRHRYLYVYVNELSLE